jgi:hypothetical protein
MMSEADEKSKGWSTSIYVKDKASFQELKRLLKLQGLSLSEEIAEFVSKRLIGLKGNGSSTQDSSRLFEELKAKHFQLSQKIDRLKSVLVENKVFEGYRNSFAKVSGYNPGEESWDLNESLDALEKFLKHCSDDAWKKAETQFLFSYGSGARTDTFLDWLESVRERFRVERKLLELRTDPEELARLDEVERQKEEQRKKEAELRKQRLAEEARREKDEREKQDRENWKEYGDEEEEDEEEEGFAVVHADDEDDGLERILEKEAEAGAEEEPEEPTVEQIVPDPPSVTKVGSTFVEPSKCRAIVPVGGE